MIAFQVSKHVAIDVAERLAAHPHAGGGFVALLQRVGDLLQRIADRSALIRARLRDRSEDFEHARRQLRRHERLTHHAGSAHGPRTRFQVRLPLFRHQQNGNPLARLARALQGGYRLKTADFPQHAAQQDQIRPVVLQKLHKRLPGSEPGHAHLALAENVPRVLQCFNTVVRHDDPVHPSSLPSAVVCGLLSQRIIDDYISFVYDRIIP